jgi:hypothetical protein
MLLLTVDNYKVWGLGGLQWRNIKKKLVNKDSELIVIPKVCIKSQIYNVTYKKKH